MRGFGTILLLGGAACGIYALFVFDPTVSTGMGRVYNVGQLQNRQNLLILAAALGVIGALFAIFGGSGQAAPRNPEERFAAAIQQGDLPTMEELLRSGLVDPNGPAPGGISWLRYAMQRDAVPQFETLLRAGADPERSDGLHRTLMAYLRDPKTQTAAVKEMRILAENPPPATLRPDKDQRPAPADAGAPVQARGLAAELTELGRLKTDGLLTAEEYERAKAKLLT